MQPRELALTTPALVGEVVEATRQVLQLWAARWGIDAARIEVTALEDGIPATTSSTSWIESSANPAARMACPKELASHLARLLYDTPLAIANASVPCSLASESARHVVSELRRLLGQAWMVGDWTEDDGTSPTTLGRWHAPVSVRIDIGGTSLYAQLPAARFRRRKPRSTNTALTPQAARAAFAHLPLQLETVLGFAEVAIADLATLQAGDVLVLDTHLTDPVHISLGSGPLTLPVTLGRQGNDRAVQFIAPSPRHS